MLGLKEEMKGVSWRAVGIAFSCFSGISITEIKILCHFWDSLRRISAWYLPLLPHSVDLHIPFLYQSFNPIFFFFYLYRPIWEGGFSSLFKSFLGRDFPRKQGFFWLGFTVSPHPFIFFASFYICSCFEIRLGCVHVDLFISYVFGSCSFRGCACMGVFVLYILFIMWSK